MSRKSVVDGGVRAAADRYVGSCFAAGSPPHVNEFARELGMTPRSLGRAFMAASGASVSAYFKQARVLRAHDLLVASDLSLDAIAHAAGFGTRVTFFRAFKRATGRTPDQYRAEHRSP